MDLAQWYAAGRWVALLDYIDMLPSASRLNEAISNDPERARELAQLPESTEKWTPRVSEYNLYAIIGREILAELSTLRATLVAVNGGKPKPSKPFPAPLTEIDRARASLETEFVEDLAGLLGYSPDDL